MDVPVTNVIPQQPAPQPGAQQQQPAPLPQMQLGGPMPESKFSWKNINLLEVATYTILAIAGYWVIYSYRNKYILDQMSINSFQPQIDDVKQSVASLRAAQQSKEPGF